LRVHGDVLILATMLWPDEVREPRFPFLADDDEWSTPSQELAMAEALIASLSDEELDPGRYRDVHRERLNALIDAKATGRTVTQDARPASASPDLLSALRASIEAAKQRRSTGNGGSRRTAASTGAAKKKQRKPAQTARGADAPKKRG
jgi:DNA end-binding protein Ku